MNIKQRLKKNENFYFYYKKMILLRNKLLYMISEKKFTESIFYKNMQYRLNLEEPKTFNEKIQWLKLNRMTKDYINCADKYELRNYVAKNFPEYKEYFPKLLNSYSHSSEIDFDELPSSFVIKCNHGCGFNFVCSDKEKTDLSIWKKRINHWMKTDYEYVACESQYHYMKKIIYAEEFITATNEGIPTDYKFYCFNGEVKIVMVCLDRIGDHASEYHYLDVEWNPLNIDKNTNLEKTALLPKPINFEKMKEISLNLSKKFDFVRIDFFDTVEKPIIGEMTFTPSGGIDTDYDYETDLLLGTWLTLH